MKLNKILNTPPLAAIIVLLCVMSHAQAAEPTYDDGVWTVPANDVAAFTNAFKRAVNGDRIVLEGGLYELKDVKTADQYSSLYYEKQSSTLTIAGKDGVSREDVIIRGNGTHRVLAVNKGTVVFTNLTITGGGLTSANNGGALNNATAYDCIISNNIGKAGGAAYGGTFRKCYFANNTSPTTGGAGYNIKTFDCTFSNNTCKGSGGGACFGGTHIRGTFGGNTTTVYGSAPGGAVGSAVCVDCFFDRNYAMNYGGSAASCYLTNCIFTAVTRGSILGSYVSGCKSVYNCTFSNALSDVVLFEASTLDRCTIIDCKTNVTKSNIARNTTFKNCLFLRVSATGGNQACMGYESRYYNCTFANCGVAANTSTIRSGCKAINCVFYGGSPCDLHLNDAPTMTNCVVTSISSGTSFPASCVNCRYAAGTKKNSLLADPANGDCHLRPGSVAQGWGLMTPDYLALIGDLDLDGNPRLTYKGSETALDLGCYMYKPLGLMLFVR